MVRKHNRQGWLSEPSMSGGAIGLSALGRGIGPLDMDLLEKGPCLCGGRDGLSEPSMSGGAIGLSGLGWGIGALDMDLLEKGPCLCGGRDGSPSRPCLVARLVFRGWDGESGR